MTNPGKMSASKLTTYKGCSMAYWLRYVAHEKTPSNVRLVFGKSIHYMIERFYKMNYKSDESFANFFKRYWFMQISGENLKGKAKENLKVTEFPTKTNPIKIGSHIEIGQNIPNYNPVGAFFYYMKEGGRILKIFYNRHIHEKRGDAPNRKPPIHNEFGFGIKKSEPFKINGHLVQGFIDRIDEMNGEWYITDYKTDKNTPRTDSFILHRHPQFTIYSLAFREIFGKKEKAILYYHLRTGKVLKTHRSEKDFDYVKGLIDEVVEGVINDKFTPFYGFHCNFCDLKVACEKYSSGHHGGPRIDLEGKIRPAEEFKEWDPDVPEEAEWTNIQSEDR